MDTDFMNTALLENKLNPKCWWKEPVRNGVTDPVCLNELKALIDRLAKRSRKTNGSVSSTAVPRSLQPTSFQRRGPSGSACTARTSMSADSSSTAITVRITASTAGSGPEIRTQAATAFPQKIFYPAAGAATRWDFALSSFRAGKILL